MNASHCSCLCGRPKPAAESVPAAPMARIAADITEGWEMFGVASGRKGGPFRPASRVRLPTLRPIEGPVEWGERELADGIASVQVQVCGEEPEDAYVKVLGANAKAVYDTWQRVAEAVATLSASWLGVEEPF